MKKFKKPIIILFSLLCVVALANLLLPMFVSVNDYRAEIQKKFQDKTGYELEMGDMSISLLPKLHVSVENVQISKLGTVFFSTKLAKANASYAKLFEGEIAVNTLVLEKPKFKYHAARKARQENQPEQLELPKIQAKDLPIDKMIIEDGELKYDNQAGEEAILSDLNLALSLTSAGGVRFAGDTKLGEEKLSMAGEVPLDIADKKQNVSVEFAGFETKLSASGSMMEGKLSFSGADLARLGALLGVNSALPSSVFSGEGKYNLSDETSLVTLEKFVVSDSAGAGKIAVQKDGKIIADLKFSKLDIDSLRQKKLNSEAEVQAKTAQNKLPTLSPDTKIRLSLKADEVVYAAEKLSEFDLQADMTNAEIVVSPLSFKHEEYSDLYVYGVVSNPSPNRYNFEGKLQVEGKDFQGMLEKFGMNKDKLKPNSIKDFSINSDLFAQVGDINSVNLIGLQLATSAGNFSGTVEAKFGGQPALEVGGSISQLDLDAILPEPALPESSEERKAKVKAQKTIDLGWLQKLPIKTKFALAIADLRLRGEQFQNLQLAGTAKAGSMTFDNMSLSYDGANMVGNLQLIAAARPQIKTNLNIQKLVFEKRAANKDQQKSGQISNRWSKRNYHFSPLDEIDADFNIQIGSLRQDSLSLENLSVTGQLSNQNFNISDLTARAFGGQLNATGGGNIGNFPSFNVNFVAENLDVEFLVYQLLNKSNLSGAANISGTLSADGQNEVQLVQSLKGGVVMAASNVIVRGFDLESFASKIANLNNPLDVNLFVNKFLDGSDKTTLIGQLSGEATLDKGTITAKAINLLTRVGSGVISGAFALPTWQMDMNAYFAIKLAGAAEAPKLGVRVYGDVDKYKLDYDYADLVSFFGKRFGESGKINNLINKFMKP